MKGHDILRVASKALIPLIFLFGLYVQFHGDFGPGGGFQAGVIFAAGFVLYALIFGLDEAKRAITPRALEIIAALGVLLYAGIGVWSVVAGGTYLDYNALDHHDPVHGQHVGILLIELGVGLTVAAVMTAIFFAFAERGRR